MAVTDDNATHDVPDPVLNTSAAVILINSHFSVSTVVTPIVRMRKVRPRGVKKSPKVAQLEVVQLRFRHNHRLRLTLVTLWLH